MSLQVDIKKRWKGFSLQVRFETGEGLLGILEPPAAERV